jgi:hypothetical protein
VIKVVRELDRYHWFGPYPSPQRFVAPGPAEPPPLALPQPPLALAAPDSEEAADGATSDPRCDPAPSGGTGVAE